MNMLELQRLALRIEQLQHTRYHDWIGGDDLEFRNSLPSGRTHNKLPDPTDLRNLADAIVRGDKSAIVVDATATAQKNWRTWTSTCQRLESLIHANDPRNPRRIMHDMARGRFPMGR